MSVEFVGLSHQTEVRGVQLSIMLHVAETRNVARMGLARHDCLTPCRHPCVVFLERKCTVAADSNVLILHYRKRI
ncbi:unnamed protein product [Brassica napus]|uniref:(rape) hypothetical protein n=1 Tax=Brassica napus TaxID=3708 RepID=A0A816I3I8_BRANA|nr:unnamed protein product [Brassica napus]